MDAILLKPFSFGGSNLIRIFCIHIASVFKSFYQCLQPRQTREILIQANVLFRSVIEFRNCRH
jgi:hypothetical protein